MAPPQLAADAPVLDVIHPLVVGIDPVLGVEGHGAALNRIDRLGRDALTRGVVVGDAGHGHEPLVGQHGLDHLACSGANREHEFVRLDLDQKTLCFQIFE